MKTESFFKTKAGELCIAGIITLCAFPVAQLAFRYENIGLCYVTVFMIILGMIFSPLRTFVFKRK